MLLVLISKIYNFFVKFRNKKYDNKTYSSYSVPLPVISIGNLTVGGSGKTPLTVLIAKELLAMGKKPAVVGRGYKKKSRGEIIVSDGKSILADADTAGDEMLMMAKQIPTVPIVSNSKKYASAITLSQKFNIDCIIVDDGFQHRILKRDLDIIIIDRNTIDHKNLIPSGLLREPFENLSRASLIVIHDNVAEAEIFPYIRQDQLLVQMTTTTGTPYHIIDGEALSLEEMTFLKIGAIAVSGIANPQRFKDTLHKSDINVINHFTFSDHYFYKIKDIQKIDEYITELMGIGTYPAKPFFITTEKDAVKLIKFAPFFQENKLKCIVMPINTEISKNRELLIDKLQKLVL